MAHLKATLLSKAEENFIHDRSIECLKEVGIRVDSESVLEMLEKKGASVDYEKNNAKITEKIVNEVLESAPDEVTLYGWDQKNDLPLPASSYPYSAMSGCSVFIRDKDTNEYRDTTAEDAADVAKLCDSLDGINILWPAVTVKDRPAMAQTLYELWITLTNCSKHFMGDAVHGAHNAQAPLMFLARNQLP